MTDYKAVQDEELEALRAIFEVSLDSRQSGMGRTGTPSLWLSWSSATKLSGLSQTFQTGDSRRWGMTSNPAPPMATRSGTEHKNRLCLTGAPPLYACAVFLSPAMHGAQLGPTVDGLPRQGKSAARALGSDELGLGSPSRSCTPMTSLSLTPAFRTCVES